jgi:exonuclease SbcC
MIELVSLHAKGFKRLDLEAAISFPKGPLLIYGLNESGKSTVMVAIPCGLFGMPLRPSRKASVEDYLNYSMDTGFVHLVFNIDGTEYRVKRTMKRNGTNVHELDIKYPDGKTESLTGARAVNTRIIDDLHGINSDALLNSCMVEQKALGKLESSNKQDRINAITLLLNLEAFTAAERELKATKNVKNSSLQKAELDLEKWNAKKEKYEEAVAEKERAEEKLKESEKELPKVLKLIEVLKEKLDAISRVRSLEGEVKPLKVEEESFLKKIEEIKEDLEEVERAKGALEESKRKLPELETRFEEAQNQVKALESLIKMDLERKELDSKITSLQDKIVAAKKDVEKSKEASKKLRELKGEHESQKNVLDAEKIAEEIGVLVDKISRAKELMGGEESDISKLERKLESLKDVEGKISIANAQVRDLESRKEAAIRNRTLGYGLGGGGVLVGIVLGVMIAPVLAILSVLSLALGVYLVVKSDVKAIATELDKQKSILADMQGARSNIEEYKERLEKKRSLVEQSTKDIKSYTDSLLEAIERLPEKPRIYKDIFDLDNIKGSQKTLERAIQDDREKLKELETTISHVSESASLLAERENSLAELQSQMGGLKKEHMKLESKIKTLQDESGVALEMEGDIRERKENLGKDISKFKQKIKGLEETVTKEEKLRENLNETKDRLEETRDRIKEMQDKIGEVLDKHEVTIEMERDLTDDWEIQVKRKGELENSIRESRETIREAEKTIEENRDAPEKYRETEELVKSLNFEVKSLERAVKIINMTRDEIVGGVKDRIEAHMMKFLPLLTAGRYNMARIDEREYKVEVYDKEARRWRMKGVFSGATQDQFSLALRLAFALSTLPTSRGVVPGFIFLDEPLSGFDDERRRGLVQLLTKGDIASQFEQIIVISHGSQLRGEFPATLHMEKGRVVEKVLA